MNRIIGIFLSVFLIVGFSNVAFAGRKLKEKSNNAAKKAVKSYKDEDPTPESEYTQYVVGDIHDLTEMLAAHDITDAGGETVTQELGFARDKRAIPILTKVLLEYTTTQVRNPLVTPAEIRVDAARSLGMIGDESAIPALKNVCENDGDRGMRGSAGSAILRIKLMSSGYKVWVYPIPEDDQTEVEGILDTLMEDTEDIIRSKAAYYLLAPLYGLNPDDEERQTALNVLNDVAKNAKNKYVKADAKDDLGLIKKAGKNK